MKNFQDFLVEGRDAPVYHGTNVHSVLNMLVKPAKLKMNAILKHPKLYYDGKFVNR